MATLSWWINLLGIIVSIGGSLLIFMGTPRDSTGMEQPVRFIDTHLNSSKSKKLLSDRSRYSRLGLCVLMCGFTIQIAAQMVVAPFLK